MDFRRLAKEIAWNSLPMPEMGTHFGFSPSQWITLPLFQEALKGGKPLLTAGWEGTLITNLDQLVQALGDVCKLAVVKIDYRISNNRTILLASESTMLQIETNERGRSAYASLATNDDDILNRVGGLLGRCLAQEDPAKGLVYTLARDTAGYSIRRLGAAGTPLERGNYTPKVLQDYDHILSDFGTISPCGRLIILSGEPGTGKTFLVRSLLSQATKAAFILVPPHLVEQLNGPEILPALTQAKNESNGAIVLVIEDADSCLVHRENGNMNAISSLLNLGDGILGALLDIRILATTNATKLQIDKATQRPGRLCRHTIIGELDAETATKVIQRLLEKPFYFKTPQTLASVYFFARSKGWAPKEIVPPRMPERPELLD